MYICLSESFLGPIPDPTYIHKHIDTHTDTRTHLYTHTQLQLPPERDAACWIPLALPLISLWKHQFESNSLVKQVGINVQGTILLFPPGFPLLPSCFWTGLWFPRALESLVGRVVVIFQKLTYLNMKVNPERHMMDFSAKQVCNAAFLWEM